MTRPCHQNVVTTTPSPPQTVFLGIDVGGTNVKLGLIEDGGQIIAQHAVPTPPLKTPERVIEYALSFANEETTSHQRIGGVGLAIPGVLDTEEMALREVVNLPGWIDRPLLRLLSDQCDTPAMVVNDANAAAFAEHSRRRLGDRSLALVTLGTGIGCGVVIGGRPFSGDHGCAGELGHIAIRFGDDALPCTCGSRGHLETYAGAGGVLTRLKSSYATNPKHRIPASLQSPLASPKDIADEAIKGDTICLDVIDETAIHVGSAIGMLGQTIDPAVVLLGGAMTFGGKQSSTGIRFLEKVRATVRETTLVQVGGNLIVDFASLGNDAGIVGAALVAKQAAADACFNNS
ncbi:ROK family protein [Rhodopirellula sp. SWK7]|uniref:ROK family protein n=1 Tax=Rhodopirellula sp. SWK7 TaxID=595460 RepID=UPI0002BF0239|nr:ROK family protein [Rhodopirellula sp. SWK7]EMI40293.1 ROK family protein [Rhodopirellula sp. SWK7]